MVQHVRLIDDLDGTEISKGAGQTVRFALDGREYRIDLTNEHADELRGMLDRYIGTGRRISVPQTRLPANPAYLWPFFAMIVLSTVGIILIVVFDESAREVGRQLLPASIVGLTVAGIGAMLNSHMADRSAAEAARERVLREVVKARDLLEVAHVIIQADHRVETYRDQALELVRAKGSLRIARALIQSTDPDKKVFEVEAIGATLKEVFNFVHELTEEYRTRFVEVANGNDLASDRALRQIESFPWLRRFLDPPTFEAEVQQKLRKAVKSIQVSSGGVRSTTPRGDHAGNLHQGPTAPTPG